MKRLIRDQLSRTGPFWLLIGLTQLLVSASGFSGLFQPIAFGIIFLVFWDLRRDHTRALLTLPVTVRQIARARWWGSVGFPALFLAGMTGVGMFGAHVSDTHGKASWGGFLTTVLLITISLGTVFLVWGGISLKPRTRVGLIIWAVLCPALIIGVIWCPDIYWEYPFNLAGGRGVLILAGVFFTFTGWLWAERLLLGRAAPSRVFELPNRRQIRFDASPGFGGLPYLVTEQFGRMVFMGLALVITPPATSILLELHHPHHDKFSLDQLAVKFCYSEGGYWLPFYFIIAVVNRLKRLRSLRTLPVSTNTLATGLALLPLLVVITLGLVVLSLVEPVLGRPGAMQIIEDYSLLIAQLAICIPVVVGAKNEAATYLSIIIITIPCSFMQLDVLTSPPHEMLPWAYFAAAVVLSALSFVGTRRVISHSSNPWRLRASGF